MPAGSTALADITSADWSLTLDANSTASMNVNQTLNGSGIGNIVQGVADINQCIGIILSTPKGSDPLRPTFATDLWQWIDAPLTIARPNLVREMIESITIWEPRVKVISITADLAAGTLNQLLITLVWQLAVDTTGTSQQQLTLTIPRNLV